MNTFRRILLAGLLLRATVNIIRPEMAEEDNTNLVQKAKKTFVEMQKDIEEEWSANALGFNKHDFLFKREKTLPFDVVRILTVPSPYRSESMLHLARVGLIATTEAFSEFPLTMQTLMVKYSWYERFENRRVIIRQGQTAINFYFIISGSMVVSVSRQDKSSGEPFEESVAILRPGQSFGELSLIYGGKRSATIVCNTKVEVLVMSRADFIRVFMNSSDATKAEHMVFLRQHPMIPDTVTEALTGADSNVFLFTYFRRDMTICQDSNTSEWIYLIKAGQCKIVKDVRLCPTKLKPVRRRPRKLTQRDDQGGKSISSMMKSSVAQSGDQDDESKEKYFVILKLLEANSIFGLETIAFESLGGTTSVALVSDGAECIAISKKFFCKHCPTVFMNWIRRQVQPFPDEKSLETKLAIYRDWRIYREQAIEECLVASDQIQARQTSMRIS
ncbi:Kinesin heavy chain [Fasciola hepatica]|uniref:Kinesin heavy chain n=1 Tax=Fasciola hepatica TaxID=6192 RepID=A0A4E0QZQ6_FASHE|nr:Kinesin heavy chain [Fasciola hepatica]